jgi:F0F1-type ATP synthase assembly protein I
VPIDDDRRDSRELGYYLALAQVGLEMVAPIGIGLVLDYYLDWSPWATVGGAVFGFVGGLLHLIVMVNRHDAKESKRGDKRP